jgi:hypothetical protein
LFFSIASHLSASRNAHVELAVVAEFLLFVCFLDPLEVSSHVVWLCRIVKILSSRKLDKPRAVG